MSKRWEARDTVSGTHWTSIAKVIPAVYAVSAQEELERKEQHMEERKRGRRECSAFRKQPRRSEEERREGLKKDQTLFNGQVDPWCPLLDLHLPRSRFPLHGSSLQARPGWLLFKLLCHRQSSLLATRSFYPRLAPILTPLWDQLHDEYDRRARTGAF